MIKAKCHWKPFFKKSTFQIRRKEACLKNAKKILGRVFTRINEKKNGICVDQEQFR